MDEQQFLMIVVYLLAGILGLCVGSFLNVVIYRLPRGMNLSKPASHCTACEYSLLWYDNIPVLSYILLAGKCRRCRRPISPRYMLVELANAAFWVLSVYLFWHKSVLYAVTAAIISSALICIFFIDLSHLLIYNRFILILAAGGFVSVHVDGGTMWYDHLIGAVAGFAVFSALYYAALWILKKEGLGLGDVKFSTAVGFLLGWQKWMLTILIASIAASLILMIIGRIRKDERQKEYPFGPFLTVGTLISLYYGNEIISWYLHLLLF